MGRILGILVFIGLLYVAYLIIDRVMRGTGETRRATVKRLQSENDVLHETLDRVERMLEPNRGDVVIDAALGIIRDGHRNTRALER